MSLRRLAPGLAHASGELHAAGLGAAGTDPGRHQPALAAAGPRRRGGADHNPAVSRTGGRRRDPRARAAEAKEDKASPKASELIQQALQALRTDDVDKGATLLDQALKAEPENHNALFLLAQVSMQQASGLPRPKNSPLFLKTAALMRRLRSGPRPLAPHEQEFLAAALYNEACTYAVEKKPDEAMKSLAESVSAGFHQAETLASDKELDSLRDRPEFQDLAKKVEERSSALARAQAKETLAATKPFKFTFELPDVNGKTVSSADLKGKVAIVDIWGTWCPPCRMEIPHFVALYEKYHDKGLDIVGINYEHEEDEKEVKQTIKSFAEKHKIPYPCVIGDSKTQDQVPDFQGFPTTLFIDRSGTVRAKLVGFDPSHAGELKALVETLLAKAPAEKP